MLTIRFVYPFKLQKERTPEGALSIGGGSGIRTHGGADFLRVQAPAVLKTAAINHSAIPPRRIRADLLGRLFLLQSGTP